MVWGAGILLLFVVGRFLSGRVLKAIRRTDGEAATPGQRALRRVYRIVVNLAGVYYFISLPLVIVLAVALPLAVGYAVLTLPFLSLPLVLMILALGLGGVITAISGLRAAFVRLSAEEPGCWTVSGAMRSAACWPTSMAILLIATQRAATWRCESTRRWTILRGELWLEGRFANGTWPCNFCGSTTICSGD